MKPNERTLAIEGLAGIIETKVEAPDDPKGLALVCHPHPLFGGTNDNKVVQILTSTFIRLDFAVLRPNFRGVGTSQGMYDQGRGETNDMLAVLDEARRIFGELPIVLAGFSFGAHVQTCVARSLDESGQSAKRLVLVGTAVGPVEGVRYHTPNVAKDTLVIHGTDDVTVPLSNVLAWAEPQDLPIIVIPGADHFFHRRLHIIRDIVLRAWTY